MKHHEREFFVNMIRSGNIYLNLVDILLYVKPLTYLQSIELHCVYNKHYEDAMSEGLMTEDEAEELMRDRGVWTYEEDEKVKGINKDLEKLKMEIYNNRKDTKLRETIRNYIRSAENALGDLLYLKSSYYSNTCEGMAQLAKNHWIVENNAFVGDQKFEFKDYSIDFISYKWREGIYDEHKIRELARSSAWRHVWSTRNDLNLPLLFNKPEELLNDNQQNLIMWSKFYDNIQESMDCPTPDVIEDDDLLDGWMIVQHKNREKEKLEKEFDETTNSKIKNSSEVFVVAKSKEHSETINKMNSHQSQQIKKQREALIKSKGSIKTGDFVDEKLQMQTMSNDQFKSKFKGG